MINENNMIQKSTLLLDDQNNAKLLLKKMIL